MLRISLVVLLVGLELVWWSRDTWTPAAVVAWVEGLGVWGPLVFVSIYCLAPALFVPGAVLTLAGGALFDPLAGVLLSLTGATVAFLLARYTTSAVRCHGQRPYAPQTRFPRPFGTTDGAWAPRRTAPTRRGQYPLVRS